MRKKACLLLCSIMTCLFIRAQDKSLKLEDLNPVLFNMDFRSYDKPTAVFCVQLSNMVYYNEQKVDSCIKALQLLYPDDDIRGEFIQEKGSILPPENGKKPKKKGFSTETELLFFGCKKFCVIAYRGTYSFKDWRTDFHSRVSGDTIYPDLPAGHSGFRQSLINVINLGLFDKLQKFISHYTNEVGDFPVYLTGHSLGAALATFSIQPLKKNFKFSGCYNFAPPFAIACGEQEKFYSDSAIIYDIVNYVDFITRANYKSLRHVGKYYRFTKKSRRGGNDPGSLFYERERLIRFSFIERILFFRSVFKFHRMDRYVERLKQECNSTNEVNKRLFDENHFSKQYKVFKKDCKK